MDVMMTGIWGAVLALFAATATADDVTVDLAQMAHGDGTMHTEHMVDQVTDPMATAASGMFRFDPSLVRLEPGEAIVFLNSTGEHTVHSIPALWGADMPEVAISNAPRVEVPFQTPGVYGLRCRRHGQYGMVMLVVVGDGGGVTDIEPALSNLRARPAEKAAFRGIWKDYQAGL